MCVDIIHYINKNVDYMLFWHTHVAINVDNKRKLICKYLVTHIEIQMIFDDNII